MGLEGCQWLYYLHVSNIKFFSLLVGSPTLVGLKICKREVALGMLSRRAAALEINQYWSHEKKKGLFYVAFFVCTHIDQYHFIALLRTRCYVKCKDKTGRKGDAGTVCSTRSLP